MVIKFAPVGRCIYCYCSPEDFRALTDEHIIAEALNGRLILPEAVCERCQVLTAKFEQIFARTMFGGLRWRQRFKSKRSRKKRQHTQTVWYHQPDGSVAEEQVHADAYPGHYLVPELPPPGILTGAAPSDRSPEFKIHLVGAESDIAPLMRKAVKLSLRHVFDWNAFNRTIAKTAHAYLVSQMGLSGYEAFLPAIVLDENPCYSHYIGGLDSSDEIATEELRLKVMPHHTGYLFVVSLSLMEGRLAYQAVAGRALKS